MWRWYLGDRMVTGMLLALVGPTLGFFYWNYLRKLIFAGDGGSIFVGRRGCDCQYLAGATPFDCFAVVFDAAFDLSVL